MSRDPEPLLGSRFRVEIEGFERAGATEVVWPEARIVDEPGQPRAVRFGPLVVRRGMQAASEWHEWWSAARRSPSERRRVGIVLLDGGNTELQRWSFSDAVPVAYSLSPLSASVSAPLIESLELAVGDLSARFAPS